MKGDYCLSWKVGQTVGTFLWPCFCEVAKKDGGGIKPPAFFHSVARGSLCLVQFSYILLLVRIIISQFLMDKLATYTPPSVFV